MSRNEVRAALTDLRAVAQRAPERDEASAEAR